MNRVVERETFYRVLKPEIDRTYQADVALWLSFKNKHDGPWGEVEH